MKCNNTKTNFIFQMLYQMVTLVIPLIIAPYLTRILGDASLGIYTFTYSIVFCFMSMARLGIDKYGQRVIASVRDDYEKLRKTFWSLYTVHVFFTIVSLLLYFCFIFFGGKKYFCVYLIQGIGLFGVIFDITWYFYGMENFKFIVLENLCVKISELLMIFVFVKDGANLMGYTFIMSISTCFGYLVIFPYVIKDLKPIKLEVEDIKEHIKPLCVLFVAVIATTIYQMIDKTLLGYLSTSENVAYYEYANKIVNVPVNLVYVMGTVLMPRACVYAAKGDKNNQIKYLDYSLQFVTFIGIGALFGLLSVANLFSVIYYGSDFSYCGQVIIALSPIIFLLGIENIVRTQYMIPNHLDKQYTICLLITAFINLGLSAILIPIIGIYGAVIGTVVAELSCAIIQVVLCQAVISVNKVIKTSIPYIISGGVMYFIIGLIKLRYNTSLCHLLVQVIVGGFCYCILSCVYLMFFSDIKETFMNEFKNVIHRIF